MEKATPATPLGVYELLLAHFGPRNWWPGDDAFEIAVGAVLTQNTSWRNVEKAIANLKCSQALSLRALAEMPVLGDRKKNKNIAYRNVNYGGTIRELSKREFSQTEKRGGRNELCPNEGRKFDGARRQPYSDAFIATLITQGSH